MVDIGSSSGGVGERAFWGFISCKGPWRERGRGGQRGVYVGGEGCRLANY